MQTQIFMVHKRHLGLRAPTVLAVGFALTILVGALVLMLPVSAADGQITPFLDALFTAASASCVTGLVTVSTAVHWSVFGKCVILLLIQIGGLGFMSVGRRRHCPSDTARAVRHVHHRRDGSGSAVLPVRAALRFPEGNHNGRVPRGFGILQRRL